RLRLVDPTNKGPGRAGGRVSTNERHDRDRRQDAQLSPFNPESSTNVAVVVVHFRIIPPLSESSVHGRVRLAGMKLLAEQSVHPFVPLFADQDVDLARLRIDGMGDVRLVQLAPLFLCEFKHGELLPGYARTLRAIRPLTWIIHAEEVTDWLA